jgi:hypothetical protein
VGLRGEENLASGGVNAAEGGIAGVEGGDSGGLGLDARGDPNGGGASSVHGGPHARANRGEKSCPVGGAFFGCDEFDRMTIDVGLNLAPERRTRATSAETNVADRNIHFLK